MFNFDNNLVIAVDLDGTLIYEEISYLSFYKFCRQFPWKIILLPFWQIRGIAYVKSCLAQYVSIDPKTLTYNQAVLDFIKAHSGRRIVLATGADQKYATAVADYLGCFEKVVASDGVVNSISLHKAERLNALYGQHKYVYLGNSFQDIAVWKQAAYAIAVNAPDDVLKDLRGLNMPYEILK